jgi:phage terminase large subunit-like protein
MKLPIAVVRAIKCGPVPKIRNWRSKPPDKLSRAERVMRFIEEFCVTPEGSMVGSKVRLLLFQEVYFYAIYDETVDIRIAILSMPRKNGKTATIAMQLLAHLVGPEAVPNSQIVSGARSREQAAQVYNYASKMVLLSPTLNKIIKIIPSGKRLVGLPLNVDYHALAAESKTAHGGSPILAILDELGQIRGPQDAFVDAITTAQGAHEKPLLVTISTQAADSNDLLSIWIDDAVKHRPSNTVCHLYAAEEDCDLTDKKAWRQANPALGVFRSTADLITQVEKAIRLPSAENSIRNLFFNQRINTVSPLISRSVWEDCKSEVIPFPPGTRIFGGLDLSARADLTAFVLIGQIEGVWHIRSWFWTPEQGLAERAKRDRTPYDVWVKQGFLLTTPGATVDYAFVAHQIVAATMGLWLEGIAYDRWRINELKREVERLEADLPLVEWGQGFKDSTPAIDAMEAELLNRRVAHGGHPVLTMCAANAVAVRDPAGGRKLDKMRSTGRIDGLQAMAQAFGLMSRTLDGDAAAFDSFLTAPLGAVIGM